jgi:hypothetical protein
MKHHTTVRPRQTRKWNAFLESLTRQTTSPALAILILHRKIKWEIRQVGQLIAKGTD